jgi:hypothetical protein
VSVVNITSPGTNLVSAENAGAAAQKTPQGRARLALVAALADTPGWFTPLSPEPAASAYRAQEKNQYLWGSQVTFPFAFALRADLEARAGGNPSWNTGVNYAADLLKSADLREVVALYHVAGLSLSRDVAKLQAAPRIAASPTARRWLVNNITYNGKVSIPVLTLHTIGDGLVVPENEQAYRANVAGQGGSALLRQLFVARAGHCAFTPAETITAAKALLQRLATGQWGTGLFSAATLNKRAAGLGSTYNVFSVNGQTVPTPPAYQQFSPPPYLRPFSMP